MKRSSSDLVFRENQGAAACLVLWLFLGWLCNSALGAITFIGTFESNPGEGVPSLAGEFHATFDDSMLPPGYSGDVEIRLDSIDLIPNTIGLTLFDLNLVGGTIIYRSGEIVAFGIGGLTSNPNRSIQLNSDQDDFVVEYLVGDAPAIQEVIASVATMPSVAGVDASPSGTLLVIPEPQVHFLVVASGCMLAFRSRRKNRSPNKTEHGDRDAARVL